ncbi:MULTISPECIES: ABC transporter substrate-binding protein [Micrococcaceae]|uniref:ABC transporter substrate-binding protein n=1 Tax=Micrococcaceae TaxID=1268 RepID=UPI00161C9A0B|nr:MULTISPECIES: ABC transporter substrate-binding protein [Micrococcaceae]MBB5750218.1 NitT/TauT family transport system substrate-binding protein [Micrococcus sp. TA1]HRO29851.1 ABC transporter substrate-binding protein [Citricoccus sp.]HRO93753.1 ABC transporter substrate-binding protein [Citricoccus sp.]
MMRNVRLAAVGAAALLALTACGSGSPSGGGATTGAATEGSGSESAAAGDLKQVEVGVIPIVDVAPIYLGVEEGIFEKHGLDVTLTLAQGGAAIVPAVQSGQMDFGFSNVTSLAIGRAQGLPLKLVATGPQTTGDSEDDFAAVMVPEDSDVKTAADLDDKRIAVNTLNNINDTVISEGIRQDGGNAETIEYVEMAFPDMVGQLEAGNVDAIGAVEPFVTIAEAAGARRIFAQYADPIPDLSVAGYFTTDQMIEQDPELVDAFVTAMKESQQYATDNPDAAKAILPEYTSLEADVIEQLTMPRFPQEHDIESLQKVIDLSVEGGLIDEAPSVEDLVRQ